MEDQTTQHMSENEFELCDQNSKYDGWDLMFECDNLLIDDEQNTKCDRLQNERDQFLKTWKQEIIQHDIDEQIARMVIWQERNNGKILNSNQHNIDEQIARMVIWQENEKITDSSEIVKKILNLNKMKKRNIWTICDNTR